MAVWIVGARALCSVAGFGLAGYLILRPFLSDSAPGLSPPASVWSEMATWPPLLANTLVVILVATGVSLALGLPLGFLLFRTDLPRRRDLVSLLIFPACLPVFVTATSVLSWVGVRAWEGNAWMAGAIHGWLGLPWAVLILGVAYRHIDGALEESAALEASWARVCMVFDLRLVLWGALAVVLFQTWLAGTDVTVSGLLAVRTFAEAVYTTFQLSQSIRAQSLVVVPYVILFGLVLSALIWAARSAETSLLRFDHHPPPTIRLGRWRWPAFMATVGLLGLWVVAPGWRLLSQSGGLLRLQEAAGGLRRELFDTCFMAFGTAAILLPAALAAGEWAVEKGPNPRRLRLSLMLLLATPTPCLAIALKELLNRPGWVGLIHDTAALPILGQALRWLPWAVLAAAPGWVSASSDVRDTARIDGCGLARLHRFIFWPLAVRYLALSLVATTAFILGELTVSVLLSPPGFLPLSVRFFTLAHYGIQGKTAAACLLMFLVMVVPWSVLVRLLDRSR